MEEEGEVWNMETGGQGEQMCLDLTPSTRIIFTGYCHSNLTHTNWKALFHWRGRFLGHSSFSLSSSLITLLFFANGLVDERDDRGMSWQSHITHWKGPWVHSGGRGLRVCHPLLHHQGLLEEEGDRGKGRKGWCGTCGHQVWG